jgi:DNA-binding LacI/PurR family transcriptional regulator
MKQRMLGWSETLDAAGIIPSVVEQPHGGVGEPGFDAALLLLNSDDPPTAILCFSDVMAYGVVRAAESLGLTVPEDVSVVGFDDNPLAKRMRPALTTVRQDAAAKGRAAASALAVAMGHARSGLPAPAPHLLLPTELIVRDSTAAPAAITTTGRRRR